LFLASQLSVDLKTNILISGNIKQQTEQSLNNIKFLLELSGSSMEAIVKVNIYMRDVEKDFRDMNEIYKDYFVAGEEPARVTVQATSPLDGIDIEIDAIVFC